MFKNFKKGRKNKKSSWNGKKKRFNARRTQKSSYSKKGKFYNAKKRAFKSFGKPKASKLNGGKENYNFVHRIHTESNDERVIDAKNLSQHWAHLLEITPHGMFNQQVITDMACSDLNERVTRIIKDILSFFEPFKIYVRDAVDLSDRLGYVEKKKVIPDEFPELESENSFAEVHVSKKRKIQGADGMKGNDKNFCLDDHILELKNVVFQGYSLFDWLREEYYSDLPTAHLSVWYDFYLMNNSYLAFVNDGKGFVTSDFSDPLIWCDVSELEVNLKELMWLAGPLAVISHPNLNEIKANDAAKIIRSVNGYVSDRFKKVLEVMNQTTPKLNVMRPEILRLVARVETWLVSSI